MAESAPNSHKITKQIFGETYTIVGEASSGYISEVADYVESRLLELGKVLPNASKTKLAVLCALNLADELFQMRDLNSKTSINPELEERTKKIISLLEEGIIGDHF
ncbi:cell division protein ZapA [Leptospira yanagawae serovar Saopaulo str. Sao Paulo = ATCC 700523]|uniref:Cell division protein ZapA n=2 Tax=Leptospira yanagawae TaxID=293069 RepID=A0ABY2M266_9LEPT|nr:cell division protein ZapA [Leptospira yanagawae]EOQ87668.1 cell division protein ZapA [Leptospira yanagawae serovar Saopaulo str. Sao Paulo = ATCC 700523]TGL21828.1 cell division protein ZapA [Leptospira yanagawae]